MWWWWVCGSGGGGGSVCGGSVCGSGGVCVCGVGGGVGSLLTSATRWLLASACCFQASLSLIMS